MKNSILLYIVIMILAVIAYNTFHNSRDKRAFKELDKQIDSLETSIENNEKVIESYDQKMEVIRDSVEVLDNRVEENNKKLEKIDQEYEQKFDSISNFYSSELQEYVARRYKDK